VPLLDHLIGAGEQRVWDREAERFRGLDVGVGIYFWPTWELPLWLVPVAKSTGWLQ
jgi:hypothetical protein